jgi:phosphoesterase RecJ-like protein
LAGARGRRPFAFDVTGDLDYRKALAELSRADRAVMTTHVKPDADGMGSMAALRRWLVSLGKTAEIVVPTPPPRKYAFMDPDRSVKVAGRDVDLAALAAPDLVVVVDTGTWLQLAGMEPLVGHSGAPVLVIDHHRSHDALADFALIDPEAAAAAVVVHRLLVEAGAAIDAAAATCLFAGLAADTDWFRLPSTDAETLRLAAALVEAGALPHDIHEKLHLSDDLTKVQLLGRAIETLRPALGGRVMVMRLTRALFRELGADMGDTENLINECMKVRGTQVGVMLVEADPDDIRVSLRCRPPVNVLRVAEHFGGGGHTRAAGARVSGSLERVEAAVLAEVQRALDAAEGTDEPAGTPEKP